MTVAQAHPWIEALVADGRNAIVSLLSGSAQLGHLSAAEPEDAVAALIPGPDSDEPATEAFDGACLEALEDFRSSILSLERPSFDVALSRLVSLVNIIRRMKPKRTVIDLHKNYVTWNAFFENFVVDRGLDLRREFWRILALTQSEAEEGGLAHRRLMPLWLSICGESGGSGRYDESYLRVALLGLRRLPLGQDFSSNEDFALHGLARWAASRNPSKAAFLREWHVLESDFPRGSDYWPSRVAGVIAAMEEEISERTHQQRKSFQAAAWWRDDVELSSAPLPRSIRTGTGPLPLERTKEVLQKIGDPFPSIQIAIDRLMTDQRRYADASGDVYYLVRTACNVGMRLIEKSPIAERTIRGNAAVRLARLAFDYDPINVYAWALFRDGLQVEGRVQDAELVGWEAIRRFPENPQWRTQLATLLSSSLGRPEEAAALLRETIILFPENAHSRNQLATILADDLGDRPEAKSVLEAARRDEAANEVTVLLLERLGRGGKLASARSKPSVAPVVPESKPTLNLPTAAARRMLFHFENGLSDVASITKFLDQHTPDAYLSYVGERTGVRPAPLKTAFAIAFEAAAKDASAARLRALAVQATPLECVLIQIAISAIESPTELVAVNDNDSGSIERVVELSRQFTTKHAPGSSAKLTLLRDVAASFVSTDVFRIAA